MSPAIATVEVTTREHILQVVPGSYLGFSFKDIAERVGIRKANLYHHCPTKASLGGMPDLRQVDEPFFYPKKTTDW